MPSNLDTVGPEESVLIREVSLFISGAENYTNMVLGEDESIFLERCPYFRGVLIEGFHCTVPQLAITIARVYIPS